jgi:CO/xanthine dehydrogenase Mo-binding subunit
LQKSHSIGEALLPELIEQGKQVPRIESAISIVGSSVQRIDAISKVQGRATFARDMELPRILHAKIKRSPHAHAEIISIDTSRAKDGVRAVITGNDFPITPNVDTPPLARGRVFYHRQAVAAVAAETPELAIEAVNSIKVSFKRLRPILDPQESLLNDQAGPSLSHPGDDAKKPNIGRHIKFSVGNLQQGFRESDLVLEQKYTTRAETHFQMEPITFLARPDADGGITVWGTTPGPTKLQYEIARYLAMPVHKVRAIVPFLGGWFGSKEENHVAAICALLALKSKRPVKLELSREETISASGVRHPSEIVIKDGVSKDGFIKAREIHAIYDGGAYGVLGNVMLKNSLLTAAAVYRIPNFFYDGYRVYTNRVPGSAKRAPMGVQMAFAIESQMEKLAQELSIDPVEFRLRNSLRDGVKNAFGELVNGSCHERALEAVAKHFAQEKDDSVPWKRGIGYALCAKWTFAAPSQAIVRLRSNGTIDVMAPVVENGQGIYTGIGQLVAEEFGVEMDMVNFVSLNTGADSTWGFAPGARSSQQLVNMGNAVIRACKQVKRKVAQIASPMLEVSADDIDMLNGCVFSVSNPTKSLDFRELFSERLMFGTRVSVPPISIGEFVGYGIEAKMVGDFDEEGRILGGLASPYYVSSAQAVKLRVNVETGQVVVEKIVGSIDAGRAINPALVRGQVEGSIMMGLSAALGEEIVFESGRVVNGNLADYKILTAVEAPEIISIILESAYAEGPHGAKGVGEAATMPTAGAVRNAIHDATGVWLNDLPFTREKILLAINNQRT